MHLARLVPLFAAASGLAQQQYPEGAPIPRSLTPAEQAWLQQHPLVGTDLPTPPPTGPVHCAAEYEPMDGLCLAWEGSTSWTNILRQIAFHATTTGQAKVYVYCDTTTEAATVQASLAAAGCNMARVELPVRATDSIWIRDYGPRYVFEGDCRAIIDHTYNRPRPNDNAVPVHFGSVRGHRVYEIPLVHGGGNFHLDAPGRGYATQLIQNENPSLTPQQILGYWQSYQNLQTTLYQPFPTTVDATQHIDMWMQVYADDQIMISDWPANSGSTQDLICDAAAVALAAQGKTVTRIPARSISGVHYTYTNMILCNDLALVPTYTNATAAQHNATALAAWQAALPGKTIVAIDCQALVTAAGVMHCICMHVPRHRGGLFPTAYVKAPSGGTLIPNQSSVIEWLADDDVQVTAIDIELSVNGGASFPYVIASNLPHTGSYTWTVPDLYAPAARLRVVARDAQGRIGTDVCDGNFAIAGSGCQAASLNYGQGKPGQSGVPSLTATPPVLGGIFTLQLQNALPNSPCWLLLGDQSASIPFDGGTMLVAAFGGDVLALGPSGGFVAPIPLPDVPWLCGFSFYLQAWIPNDPGASGAGWAASGGLQLRLGH